MNIFYNSNCCGFSLTRNTWMPRTYVALDFKKFIILCQSNSIFIIFLYIILTNPLSYYVCADGPLSMNISGHVGPFVYWTCSADSRPDCDFLWFFNKSTASFHSGPAISFPATKEREGNYTCKARNPVTNITMYKTKVFTVTGKWALLQKSFCDTLIKN